MKREEGIGAAASPQRAGWLKLSYKLLQWRWFQDGSTLRLWIWLLLRAQREAVEYKHVRVGRGEVATTHPKIALETGLSVKMVRNALRNLQKTGEVAVRRAGNFSILTVLSYDLYQCRGQSEGSPRAVRGQSEAKPSYYNKKEYKSVRESATAQEEKGTFSTDEFFLAAVARSYGTDAEPPEGETKKE